MIFRRFQQYVGSVVVQVAAELCVSCACSARQHLHLRVKEDNCTKETYINTAKAGFALKTLSPFIETLPEVQSLFLHLTSKTITVSISF